MAGGGSVSYEVYYLQYGRWQIHHRYNYRERDNAIDEAKRLDKQGHFNATCVIRENWDDSTGTASESVIYHSPNLKAKPPVDVITAGNNGAAKPAASAPSRPAVKAPPGSAAANAQAEAKRQASIREAEQKAAQARRPEPREPPLATMPEEDTGSDWADAIPKLLLAFLIACLVGTVVGVAAFYGLKFLSTAGVALGIKLNRIVLIGAWLVGWGATFVPMMKRILAKVQTKTPASKKSQPSTISSPAMPRPAASMTAVPAVSPTEMSERSVAQALEEHLQGMKDKEEALSFDLELDEEEDGEDDEAGDLTIDEESVDNLTEQEDPPTEETAKKEETAEEELLGTVPLNAALAELVEEAIAISKNSIHDDQFLRFGIILFLAGAAETFARKFKVAARDVTTSLAEQIQKLGVSASMALGFAANIDEYLLDPRYFDMYSSGRGAAIARLQDAQAGSGLKKAFKFWKTPKAPPGQDPDKETDPKHYDTTGDEESHAFVSVLFTDIVGSTAKQQKHGDAWLMNVVRAHNDIVREAIGRQGGREIKHTGDGIMASFPEVETSVAAALLMHEGIAKFSGMMPDLAFEICVGISCGEPIHESGDLFGTPVNLAARVLAKAKAHETAVSNAVRDICESTNFEFEEIGKFDLKGFDAPQPIYRVKDRRKKRRK